MNKILMKTTLMLILGLLSLAARADFTQIRGNAIPAQISTTQTNNLTIQWQVFADATTAGGGVTSVQGQAINPQTGAVLLTQVGTLAGSGTSPLAFNEALVISAAQAQLWRDAGITRVLFKRIFSDVATSATLSGAATISLINSTSVLSRELTPDLVIQRLSLHFNDLQSYAVVEKESGLNATLTIEYRGQGRVNGRWQWAYDDGSDTELQYRTLQVVQQNLAIGQRYQLVSPSLTTRRTGRYRVRFCLAAESLNDCAQPAVEASYQVMDGAASQVQILPSVSPLAGSVNSDTNFQWPQVKGGVVYQLQLFQLEAGAPQFITGMWLPASSKGAALSPLVRSKLQEGKRYQWRVLVFDQNGNPIARSEETEVVWQP